MRHPSDVPNAQAIVARFWMPGINEGYVPQGLAVAGDSVAIAAYRSVDAGQGRGPARVFVLATADGKLRGAFDLPERYGHPGGLACDGHYLYVADFGRLAKIDLARALAAGGQATLEAERSIDPAMGPSFLDYNGKSLWFGRYVKSGAPKLYAFAPNRVFSGADSTLTPAEAERSLPIPPLVQGVGFDTAGTPWLSASSSHFGKLYRLNASTSAVEAEFDMPAGIEDLGFDVRGMLWSVSEAGSRRWQGWQTFFPVVFTIDTAKLHRAE